MGKKAKRKQKKHQRHHGASPMKKIRVGYIAAEFCNTPEADFLPALLAARDKTLFTVTGIQVNRADDVTKIFASGTDAWLDVSGMEPQQAAEEIRRQQLDFLVDASMKPSAAIDEIMALQPARFMQKLSSWCYTPFDKNKEYCVTAPCLYKGYITFGVLGSLFQSPEVLSQVMEVLLAMPDSHLLLSAEDVRLCQSEDMNRELRELGVSSRILLSEGEAYPYEEVDIFLGVSGVRAYNLCQAYNRSVPVILYAGYAVQEVFVADVVKMTGQEALYTESPAQFKEIALGLAKDVARLSGLHRSLYDKFQASSVMDLDRYILQVEHSYLDEYVTVRSPDTKTLLRKAAKARQQKDWNTVVLALSRVKELPAEEYLNLAWAYYFLKDSIRALYWAKQAEKSAKPLTALYLQEELLTKADRYEEAWQAIDRAFALEKQGEKILPEIREPLMIVRAALAYRVGREETADLYWQAYENSQSFPDKCLCYSSWLLTYNRLNVNRQELYEKHLGYGKLFADIKPYVHKRSQHQHDKLRIGYISPDFRAHVMSHFLWPFLASYNRDNFAVYVYSLGKEDQYTETFKSLVDKWQNLQGEDFAQLAARIYEDEVDILFDLAGHTSNSGLPVLAYKPAPVQLSGLGYMTTTGLPAVDYFLTDAYVDPPGLNEDFFVEKLLRLRTQFCYTGEDNWPESTVAPCRQRGWVMFGVFNHFGKITAEMLVAWQEILARVPHAKLLIKGNVLCDRMTVKRIYAEWEQKGLPMDRIIFEPSSADYMLRYLDVDIALDTYPYPGGGTTCDALYMGVPVISRYGKRHSSRFGYSILCNIGLTELLATSNEEYIEKAVALASDWELLDIFHQKLRRFMKKSPLMDVKGYISEVEAAYRCIWQEHKWS